MAFTRQHIAPKIFCIVDVGSYKLRVLAARYKNQRIEILWYHEKRQDITLFSNQECHDLPGLCESISQALAYVEDMIGLKLPDIVLNYPFGELYTGSKYINYKRKKSEVPLSIEELEHIMEKVEKLSIQALSEEAQDMYGLSLHDQQILLSRVNSIKIDGRNIKKAVGKLGEELRISLVNTIIPKKSYNLLSQIGHITKRSIFRILPTEYALSKLFPQKNILIINVGATQTSLTVKNDGDIIGISKLSIGINNLVNKISKNHDDTRAHIISELSSEWSYSLEKKSFLQIWGESVGIALEEMLQNTICPEDVFIGWGGGKNDFLKEYIQNFPFSRYDIKTIRGARIVQEDMGHILSHIESVSLENLQRIPLEMYALLLEVRYLLSHDRDILSHALQTAIERLGYTLDTPQ